MNEATKTELAAMSMTSHRGIALLWGVFAIMFLCMAGFHFFWSTQSAPLVILPARPFAGSVMIQIQGAGVDEIVQNFANQYNAYIAAQNASAKWQNILSGSGYVFAALTAVLSLVIEMAQDRHANQEISQGNDAHDDGAKQNAQTASESEFSRTQDVAEQTEGNEPHLSKAREGSDHGTSPVP